MTKKTEAAVKVLMKKILIAILTVLFLTAMPWGTKEANDDCLLHDVQVMIWEAFGSHPDAFYAWRDR